MIAAGRARSPRFAIAAIVIAPLLFHLAILATRRTPVGTTPAGLFKLSFVTVSALAHWSLYTGLLMTFALTLRRGQTPLITAMAERLHGGLTAEMARYTRGVTLAWALFFAAQLATSILLFCLAPLPVWSVFVNLLDVPLVAIMFAGEYAVRLCVLRDPPRHSLAMIVRLIEDCMKAPMRNSSGPAASPPP